MKKLEGSDVTVIKRRIRKMVNARLDMKEEKIGSLREIVRNSRVPYVTALKWKDIIMNQERIKRLKKRILI